MLNSHRAKESLFSRESASSEVLPASASGLPSAPVPWRFGCETSWDRGRYRVRRCRSAWDHSATRTGLSTRARDFAAMPRLDALLVRNGFHPEGGSDLFRLHRVPNATGVHVSIAHLRILVRASDHSGTWIRFGLPGSEDGWNRLGKAVECLI